MSEPMTVELVVESEWRLKGYWTKLRVPIRKTGDIDVLAFCPERKHLVIAESKVQGKKNQVFAGAVREIERDAYLGPLLESLPLCCANGEIFQDFQETVDRLTVQLVSNWVIDPSNRQETEADVLVAVKDVIPINEVDVKLDTTLEVLSRVIEEERRSKQTKRYGHPILDIAREINRYLDPSVSGAGRAMDTITKIKRAAIAPLLCSLGLLTEPNYVAQGVD